MNIWDTVIREASKIVYRGWPYTPDDCPCCDLHDPDACCTCNQRVD